MSLNIKKVGKNLNLDQDAKESELDKEFFDVNIDTVGEDANVKQHVSGSKVKSKWVWIILAIGTAVAGVAAYYFSS